MLKYIIALFTSSFLLLVLFVYLTARMCKDGYEIDFIDILCALTTAFASAMTYGFGFVFTLLTLMEFLS